MSLPLNYCRHSGLINSRIIESRTRVCPSSPYLIEEAGGCSLGWGDPSTFPALGFGERRLLLLPLPVRRCLATASGMGLTLLRRRWLGPPSFTSPPGFASLALHPLFPHNSFKALRGRLRLAAQTLRSNIRNSLYMEPWRFRSRWINVAGWGKMASVTNPVPGRDYFWGPIEKETTFISLNQKDTLFTPQMPINEFYKFL